MQLGLLLLATLGVVPIACDSGRAEVPVDSLALQKRLEAIDREMPGNFGVYARHVESGAEWRHEADRLWYQASTVKVPVAITVLQLVEEGELSLDDTLVLEGSDFVDGAGGLLYMASGTELTVRELIRRSLTESDSTATDMLIRLVGERELNHRVRTRMAPEGFERITTILQVRFDAYGEIHPDVDDLSNMDFVRLGQVPLGEPRYRAFLDKLPDGSGEARADGLTEAFERYYERGLNSATLEAFGGLLRRLQAGELLSPEHTELVLNTMKEIETGDRRIAAGLPTGTAFAQKTGTQVARACNVGVVEPRTEDATVLAACAERFVSLARVEEAFQEVGAALEEVVLPDGR